MALPRVRGYARRAMPGKRRVVWHVRGLALALIVLWARGALAEAAGSAIFVPAMATLGFLFSDRAEILARDVSRVHHWLVLLGLLALALYLGLHAWIGRSGLEGEGPVTAQSPRGGKDARD